MSNERVPRIRSALLPNVEKIAVVASAAALAAGCAKVGASGITVVGPAPEVPRPHCVALHPNNWSPVFTEAAPISAMSVALNMQPRDVLRSKGEFGSVSCLPATAANSLANVANVPTPSDRCYVFDLTVAGERHSQTYLYAACLLTGETVGARPMAHHS